MNLTPLIFKRPAWWYLFSGAMLLLAGGASLFSAIAIGDSGKPGARPTCFVLGTLTVLGAVVFFGFSCQTVIDFVRGQVTYEWRTFFLKHRAVYPLSAVHHVGARRGATPHPGIYTHHVFLAIANAGSAVMVQLQEIVKHDQAVKRGRKAAQILAKPFVDYT